MLNREKMLRHLQLVMIILAFASLLEFFGGIFLVTYYNTLIGTSQQIGLILLEETTRKVLSLMVSSLIWNMEELFPSAVILGDITGKFIIIIGVALALISMEKSLRGSSEAVDISNLNRILIVVLIINFLANFWSLLFYLTRLILFLVLIAYAYTLS